MSGIIRYANQKAERRANEWGMESRPPFKTFAAKLREVLLFNEFTRVCLVRGVTLEQAYTQRTTAATAARRECYERLRQRGQSVTEIGALWGRDYTSVIAALHKDRRLEREGKKRKATALRLEDAYRVVQEHLRASKVQSIDVGATVFVLNNGQRLVEDETLFIAVNKLVGVS